MYSSSRPTHGRAALYLDPRPQLSQNWSQTCSFSFFFFLLVSSFFELSSRHQCILFSSDDHHLTLMHSTKTGARYVYVATTLDCCAGSKLLLPLTWPCCLTQPSFSEGLLWLPFGGDAGQSQEAEECCERVLKMSVSVESANMLEEVPVKFSIHLPKQLWCLLCNWGKNSK